MNGSIAQSSASSTAIIILSSIALSYLVLFMFLVASVKKIKQQKSLIKSLKNEVSNFQKRYSPIIDLNSEYRKIQVDIETLHKTLSVLRESYSDKKLIYDNLVTEIAVFEDKLSFSEIGIYDPHFDFGDSEIYKSEIMQVQGEQKRLIYDKKAVLCLTNWTVNGSKSQGDVMTNRHIKLSLRAFNNECDVNIANVRWNNVKAMEKRISRAREQIDKLNKSNNIVIDDQFFRLKMKELQLAHEYREKLKVEKEERAEAGRLAREEIRLQRDLKEAQDEEERYRKLLDKAKVEAGSVSGPKLEAFQEQIRMLERELVEARDRAERAQAMAERTRSGYVYIISNIGSFGEGVIKIGLTRRLDPLDRVQELSGASVPFAFDTHAIIYSDDAPKLEHSLHQEFEPHRVNAQNNRKEFFRVSLDNVEAAVKNLAPQAPFFKDVEAQEYRETLARRRLILESTAIAPENKFPDTI